MNDIFISYRRADTQAICDRMYGALRERFGKDRVFRDIDSLAGGAPIRASLATSLRNCHVIIVLLGAQWTTLRDAGGNLRIFQPDDYVRMEVESALALAKDRNVTVLPVKIGDYPQPTARDLPPTLQPLLDLNIRTVRYDPDFKHDMLVLLEDVARALPPPPLWQVILRGLRGTVGRGASTIIGLALTLWTIAAIADTAGITIPVLTPLFHQLLTWLQHLTKH